MAKERRGESVSLYLEKELNEYLEVQARILKASKSEIVNRLVLNDMLKGTVDSQKSLSLYLEKELNEYLEVQARILKASKSEIVNRLVLNDMLKETVDSQESLSDK